MVNTDFNKITIDSDLPGYTGMQKNYSTFKDNVHFDSVRVYFKEIETRLIDVIKENKNGAIFGCVAWFTSFPVLKALSYCKNVQIIVQKEDFLRQDNNIENKDEWKLKLKNHYNNLRCSIERCMFKEPISKLSFASDPIVEAVRCVGNLNSEERKSNPRMHNKFLVFCRLEEKYMYKPIALWTGSFNFTKNAMFSFENAIYLVDKSGNSELINAYLNEHHQIFTFSEKLNWESEWIEPEYSFGT